MNKLFENFSELVKPKIKKGYFQKPCVEVNPVKNVVKTDRKTGLQWVAEKKFIWKRYSEGTITLTFGGMSCAGCSPEAAWSLVGSDSSTSSPSMNLGFIDPPLSSFSFDGKNYPFELFKDETRNYCEVEGDKCIISETDQNKCVIDELKKIDWVPGATIIHEFGHALGMLHEHQNGKENNIKIIPEKIISYYRSIGMTAKDAEANVIKRYTNPDEYVSSVFDPESIMLYCLPCDWVDGPNPTKPNFKLSKLDIEFLQTMYPKQDGYPMITIKFLDNGPKWKEAWVQKIVSQEILPLACIGMKFILSDGSEKNYLPDKIYKHIKEEKIKEITDMRSSEESSGVPPPPMVSNTTLREREIEQTPEPTQEPTQEPESDGSTLSGINEIVGDMQNEGKLGSLKNTIKENFTQFLPENSLQIKFLLSFIIIIIIILLLNKLFSKKSLKRFKKMIF